MMQRVVALTILAFCMALIHSCSLNNEIITPPCKVFEADLTDRWWYPQGGKREEGIYFCSSGNFFSRQGSDSTTYTLTECNKLTLYHHTRRSIEGVKIVKLLPDKLVLLSQNGKERTYLLQ